MTQQLLMAGEAMFRALNNLPCACVHNVPYAGLPEPQVVKIQCGRCRAMAAWRLVTAEKPASASRAEQVTLSPLPTVDVADIRTLLEQTKPDVVREVFENLRKGRWSPGDE